MATLDLMAPGAGPAEIAQGLAAAGDVIRASGMGLEFIHAGRLLAEEHRAGRHALPSTSWHWRANAVFLEAQEAALRACFGTGEPPSGAELLIVTSKGPASFLD